MRKFLCTMALLWALTPTFAAAGVKEGYNAFMANDWVTAKVEMQPLAENGVTEAQIAMGLLYARGHAVPQNWDSAASWFDMALQSTHSMPRSIRRMVLSVLAKENLKFSIRQSLDQIFIAN